MTIIEILAIMAVGFSIAYMIHMKARMEESIMEMKRASCRMRQLEEEIEEMRMNESKEERYQLQYTDA